MKKKAVALMLSAVMAMGMVSAVSVQASVEDKTLIVGFDAEYPPYGYMDENGEYTGFDLELAQAVCDLEGWTLDKKPINWDSKDMELNSGSIDCIWNGFTMTPERQKALAFTKPYMDNVQVYVVLADSAVQKAEELKGKKLSIQESSTAQTLLDRDENLKKSFGEIKAYPDLTACFMDLESGRADAVLADTCLIEYYMTKKPNKFRELPGEVSKDTFSIGIKKDNKVLVDILNDGIDKVIKNGEAAKISQKWFGKDIVLK